MRRNGKWDSFSDVIVFVDVIITPHSDPLLADFVELLWAEDILIEILKQLYVIVHNYIVSKENTKYDYSN